MTTEVSIHDATTLSRMNFAGCVGHVTTFTWMFTIACCLVVYAHAFWLAAWLSG